MRTFGILTALKLAVFALYALPGCGSDTPGAEGSECVRAMDCEGALICFQGVCRRADCLDLDCPTGWACVAGLCCNREKCCGFEGPAGDPSCDNGADDDCDGWTDGDDSGCSNVCMKDSDCDDGDHCTDDRCQQGNCVNETVSQCCTGDGSFAEFASFPDVDDPAYVQRGDLDGDGVMDLIVAIDNTAEVGVLLGLGNGSFAAAAKFSTGNNPICPFVADLNGDGRQDIAVVITGTKEIDVLLNTGTGPGHLLFAPLVAYQMSGEPYGMTGGDLDGDGDVDLVAADSKQHQIVVLLGAGDGSFGQAAGYEAGDGPHWVVLADLNGDSALDAASADYNGNTVSVMLGRGDGSFGARSANSVDAGPRYLVAADLNGDGVLDLISANKEAGNASVLMGHGDGSFDDALHYGTGIDSEPRALAVGDFNGDGKPDFAVACYLSESVSLYSGIGDGFFAPLGQLACPGHPDGIASADFNADRIPDLAVSCSTSNDVKVFLGQGVCE